MQAWEAEVEEFMDWRQQQELDEEYEAEMMAADIRRIYAEE